TSIRGFDLGHRLRFLATSYGRYPATRHLSTCCRSRKSGTLPQMDRGSTGRRARSLNGNFDLTANTVRREGKVDGAAELARNELTDDAGAVFAFGGSANRRTADLAPYHQKARRLVGGTAAPTHLHPAMRGRKRTVFRGVCH